VPIHFQTKFSGELIATGTADMNIELCFPETPVTPYTFSEEDSQHFLDAFGYRESDLVYVGKSIYDMFVEVTPEAFYSIKTVNYSLLEHFKGRGVIVTTVGGKRTQDPGHLQYDFVSRFFAPLFGIPEDPVTGSAHCALSSYWFDKLGIPKETDTRTQVLDAYQASKRGGAVKVSLLNDRVFLGGKGITTMTAKILV
jgi:predicted PhzF superfamily epimerase YddE/YHI9